MADDGCRIDVWLWRARLCKTRTLAAHLAESGRVRLTRGGAPARLDKASRTVRPGDELVFAMAGRLAAIRILALGDRRGPPAEARGLYEALDAGLTQVDLARGDWTHGEPARLRADLDASPALGASGGDDPAPRH